MEVDLLLLLLFFDTCQTRLQLAFLVFKVSHCLLGVFLNENLEASLQAQEEHLDFIHGKSRAAQLVHLVYHFRVDKAISRVCLGHPDILVGQLLVLLLDLLELFLQACVHLETVIQLLLQERVLLPEKP